MDKATANLLGREIEEALREVAERHGLTLVYKGGQYTASSMKPRIEFRTADHDAALFAEWAEVYGLRPEDLGATFTAHGKTFAIAGVAPRNTVRPILCQDVRTGKRYKFPIDSVKYGLARAGA